MAKSFHSRNTTTVFIAIVFAQFCGTSLWFAGNAILPQWLNSYDWPDSSLGHLTGIVQLGFITGTLTIALTGLADKISPSLLFFISSIAAALTNAFALLQPSSFTFVLISRGLTGFCLAGIYPIGMKIAADWTQKGLGQWLGLLVGALVLGTSFPHALKLFPNFIDAANFLITLSAIAIVGGLIVWLLVPDGPYRKKSTSFSFNAIHQAFKTKSFRIPAIGYFGHMWELYAFWAFVPWVINHYSVSNTSIAASQTLLAFIIIASGAFGCIVGGNLAVKIGSKRTALYALIASALTCLASPLLWHLPPTLFIVYMIFWGIVVVADSPQFSALVAQNVSPEIRGSAITIVTCIGFSISIGSIQLLNFISSTFPLDFLLLLLAPGPVIGILFMITRR